MPSHPTRPHPRPAAGPRPRGRLARVVVAAAVVAASVAGTGPAAGRREADLQAPESGSQFATLTAARDLRALTVEQAADTRPVRLRGVVTYFEPLQTLGFVQDETGGVFFSPVFNGGPGSDRPRLAVSVGDWIEIEGLSAPGSFVPYLRRPADEPLPRVRVLGTRPLPEPVRIEPGRLLTPSLDACWVEAIVTVRHVRRFSHRLQLDVTNGVEEFAIIIPLRGQSEASTQELQGSLIAVRGVFGSITDSNRRLVNARILCPGLDQIRVLDEGSRRAFENPVRAVSQLLQFRGDPGARVHVRGVVTAAFPGRRFFLRSDGAPLAITTTSARVPTVGREVNVVGFPMPVGDTVVLHTPDHRLGAQGPPPPPVRVPPADLTGARWHGELVLVEARLLDSFLSGSDCTLLLGDGSRPFSARLTLQPGERIPSLTPHSYVQVTGIALLDHADDPARANAGGVPRGFSLLLRSPDDLVVLSAPPFWTSGRILVAAGASVGALLLTVGWVVLLRRKVRQQTALIAATIEREKVADERARIARELHDTVEQELAGIGLQLDLALARATSAPERAQTALDLALRMLRRTQQETRRSIQDLRSERLERGDLASALGEVARELREERKAPLHVRIEQPAHPLPALTDQHLLRLAHEALSNAANHAHATRIDLALVNTPEGLRLSVTDDGVGLDPAHPRPGRFGLQGMRERALKIGALFDLQSAPRQGCRITVLLPAK